MLLLLLLSRQAARASSVSGGQVPGASSAGLLAFSARAGVPVQVQAPARQKNQQIPADSDPCAGATVDQPDPLTGLPAPPSSTASPPVCPVPVTQNCPAPTAGAPAADDWLLGSQHGLLVATSGADTYGGSVVQKFWGIAYSLAMALLALPLVLAGLQLARGPAGSSRADAAELLSRILLAACAAGLSYFAIRAFIDLESALANQLFTTVPAPTSVIFMPSASWSCNTQQFFGSIFNLSVYDAQNIARQITVQQYMQDVYETTSRLVVNLGNYGLTLLSILLALQLSVRLALLNMYIIVSPVTIICSALTEQKGADVTRAWLNGFASLVFVQILQLLALWLGSRLIPASFLSGTAWMNEVLAKVIPISLLGIVLGIPRLTHSSATGLMSTVSSSIGNALVGIILIIRGV